MLLRISPPPRRLAPEVGLLAAILVAPFAFAGDTELDQALEAWRAIHGSGWELEVDPETSAGSLLWGGAVSPGRECRTEAELDAFAVECARLASSLHGLDLDCLRLERTVYLPLGLADTTDKHAIRLVQQKNGIPVLGGYLNLLLAKDGTLLCLESTGVPGLDGLVTEPGISTDIATRQAVEDFRERTGLAPTFVSTPELVIVQQHEASRQLRKPTLAWRLLAFWEDEGVKPEAFAYSIDAQTAGILARDDAVHALDVTGQITSLVTAGLYPPDHPSGGATEAVAMPRITIDWSQIGTSQSGSVESNESGNFTIPGISASAVDPVAVTVHYSGAFADIDNKHGLDFSYSDDLTVNSGNTVLMNPDEVEEWAQANAYHWINRLRQFIGTVNPSDTVADIPSARIDVNLGFGGGGTFPIPGCLGKYVGGSSPHLELYRSGPNCFNDSYSTSLVHEMGHWLNDRYGLGNPTNGMGEGNADIFAMYLFGVPEIALGISSDVGFDFVRTGENSRRYCGGKQVGCYGNLHEDAWPLMGAFWKMRERLIASEGATNGALCAATLHNAWVNMFAQTEIKDNIVIRLLTLDDDDGDLRNGTPHYADITRGFMDQGWPDKLPGGILFTNLAPQPAIGGVVGQTTPHSVTIKIEPIFHPPLASGSPTLHYRHAPGGFTALAPSASQGDTYTFQVPGPTTTPARVDYYFSATDSVGQTLEYPPLRKYWRDATAPGESDKYALPETEGDWLFYFVGTKEVLYSNNLDPGGDADFVIFSPYPNQQEPGWLFAAPTGGGATTLPPESFVWTDPPLPYSGAKAWIQDDVSAGSPTHDRISVSLRMNSPISLAEWDAGEMVFLRFRRWLTLDRGSRYRALIGLQLPDEGFWIWENHPAIIQLDSQWNDVFLDLTGVLAGQRCLPWIEWRVEAGPLPNLRQELGGWNLDDIELFVISSVPPQ